MLRSRWGVLAVNDHRDAGSLVPEVLLYDRLVFPYPTGADRARWVREGWDPDLLDARLDSLGDLAESVPWDFARRNDWRGAMEDIQADARDLNEEVRQALPYSLTRRRLAQSVPRPSSLVDVVAAYPSRAALEADYRLGPTDVSADALVALQYEFLTLDSAEDPEAVLGTAVTLAKDETFRKHRQEFYHWQSEYLAGRMPLTPAQAVEAMQAMVMKYNDEVRRADKKHLKKAAFYVASAALSITGALVTMNPLPLAGTLLSLVQFLTLDRRPVVSAGQAAPAAMFHDAQGVIGR